MDGFGIHAAETVALILMVLVVLFAVLAQRIKTPYPIVLVIAGLVLSFIPQVPKIHLNPDVVFLIVLPPLLYSGAWQTSWLDFRKNIVSITMLAVGLVTFTAIGVAYAAPWVFKGFDWHLGFVLGAVVSTTDAIAATAIARDLGLPKRIVDILEGESLVNDATGLVALAFAVALVVTGERPTIGQGGLRLTYLIGVGIVVGLLIGLTVEWFERRLEDGPIEIAVSIIVPYVVYLTAEAVHASGVMAVIACGLYLARKSSELFSPTVRIQAWAVWESLTFVLNGLVFMALGLQLPYVIGELKDHKLSELIAYGLALSVILILLRLIWMYPGTYISIGIRRYILREKVERPPASNIFVVGWTGMRGVVALAAAISLPEMLKNGSKFPQRNMIIFLTFAVILVTLVGQGLTLPPLIRALGLAGTHVSHEEEHKARQKILRIALERLNKEREKDSEEFSDVYDALVKMYQTKIEKFSDESRPETLRARARTKKHSRLMQELVRVERRTAVHLRNEGEINDELLRQIERELDLTEERLTVAREDEKLEG
ncbi:MAG: Na+/H+ antiporter [Acidobacteria bacterium]|nr:Na+/H+ antiporter [Acidobacteriota bacterium]MBS1866170.1 Na+/H+ antiporter [Acidobacteriota bacterium]